MTGMLVIGIGNDFRCDDAAGLEVARCVRARAPAGIEVMELDGEPSGLVDAWSRAGTVVVVDAVASDDPPGTIHRIVIGPDDRVAPASHDRRSTHAMGLGHAVEFGRALDRLPDHLLLVGITGAAFGHGQGVSPQVRAAIDRVVDELCRERVTADVHE